MPVPFIFGPLSSSQGIPLSWLDADFAYVSARLGFYSEELVITTTNIIPNLSHTPNTSDGIFLFIINGMVFVPVGSSPPFLINGKQITWLSTTWAVSPGDSVVVVYSVLSE